jgi:5-methylcytosine-specific restriction endonuclease McrA
VLAALVALLGCKPDIPHAISSRTDTYCRTCHTGRAGAPASHDKAGCVSCHDVTAEGAYPEIMPHRGGELERCSLCHRDGAIDAGVAKHLDESDCYTCHQAAEYGPYPPGIAHEVEQQDRASCLLCHEDLDHAERESCLGCHGI